jgi:hypothetical protein
VPAGKTDNRPAGKTDNRRRNTMRRQWGWILVLIAAAAMLMAAGCPERQGTGEQQYPGQSPPGYSPRSQ